MKEIRNVNEPLTATDESRAIEGYALVFDSESVDLGGFREIIHRSALQGVIEHSDVLCLLDHNQQRGVLARSRSGVGSLTLTVDDRGLKYRFEAPRTPLGDEVLEGCRRGDLSASSFSFRVKTQRWEKRSDGSILRHIDALETLYDVSPVYHPAYDATSVAIDRRGLDELIASEEQSDEKEPDDDTKGYEPSEEPEEKRGEPEQTSEEEEQAQAPEEIDTNQEKRNNMPKFLILKAVRDIVSGAGLDATAQAVDAEGRAAFAGLSKKPEGQLVIPVAEYRAEDGAGETPPAAVLATVATHGKEAVATEKLSIVGPLRSAMVLSQAGATYLTGLVGDISIPFYSGSNVGWAGEIAEASNGKGTFSDITLSPKRLTAYLDISKQFLIQDSVGAEELLRSDIIAALAEKLEKTILGAEAGDNTKPAGLFNGVSADTAAFKYGDVIDMEESLESANVTGSMVYVVNPKAKATMRKTAKDSGSGRFVMEGNEVEGVRVLSSSAVTSKGLLLGNFRELIIGQWGGLDLTIDPYTLATKSQVRIVINAFFDAKVRRPAALVKRILK